MKIALLVLALMLLALGWTFAPITLAARELELGDLPAANPPPEMSISALPTAEISSRAALAFRGGSFADPRTFAQTALLVHHPRGDLLFDTGLGVHAKEHFAQTPFLMRHFAQLTPHTPASVQLRNAGYDPTQLAGIVLTHAHWDHVSGVPDFPGTPVWMNDRERVFVESGDSRGALMRGFGAVPTRRYTFGARPYLGFSESFDVWGDGSIVLVPAPGHSPGSILAFLTLPSQRRLVLLGDLVWQLDAIERPAERPWPSRRLVDSDPEQVRTAIAHVAALHRRFPELALMPAHDQRAFRELPVFPATAH